MKRSFVFARFSLLTCTFLLGCVLCAVSASANTCSTNDCHADLGGFKFSHAALEEDGCFSCHEQIQDQHPGAQGVSFNLMEDGSKLCYQCHDRFGKKLTIHDPVKDGSCTDCHNPHGSNEGRFLLPVDYNQTELCMNCHDSEGFSQKVVHGPAASGACTQCHNPHESNQPQLLKKSKQKTCTGCHEEIAEGMANSPVIHEAVEEESCTSCHNPHSAPSAKLLQKGIQTLCMDCHGDIGRKVKKAKVQHAALYRDEKCSACHATHFSAYPGLLKQSEKETCLSCHGKDDYNKSKPLKNIAKEIKDKKSYMDPFRRENVPAVIIPMVLIIHDCLRVLTLKVFMLHIVRGLTIFVWNVMIRICSVSLKLVFIRISAMVSKTFTFCMCQISIKGVAVALAISRMLPIWRS